MFGDDAGDNIQTCGGGSTGVWRELCNEELHELCAHLVLLECRFQKDEMGRACRNTFVVGNPEVWRHVE